jgi:RND family efflux transporter MFP subunit
MIQRFLVLVGCLLLLVPAGCGHRPSLPKPPAVQEVTVAVPIAKEITNYEDFTGRTDAIYTVEVKARVTGYLVKVYFKDGSMVRGPEPLPASVADAVGQAITPLGPDLLAPLPALLFGQTPGDPLYEIDPRPYQADLGKAEGQVERLLGQKKLLDTQVDRYTKLVAKGAASQQDLDEYLGKQAENLGALAAARAQVVYAKLYLSFCTIRAPISGQISRTYIQIGNVINADTTLLTTLVSTDPMYAYFSVEEPIYLRIQKLIASGTIPRPKAVPVRMGLSDDVQRKFPLVGTLDFVNNIIDPLTGTITVRGVFDNLQLILKPGLFARVRVPLEPRHKGLLVAEQAISTDQGQKFLYVVDMENKVHYRRVRVGQMHDGLRAIEEGLQPGERVVVNGLQRVRPGAEVNPQVVDMASLATGANEVRPPVTVKSAKK